MSKTSTRETRDLLTDKQQAIYNFMLEHTRSHGYPPTVRDIGDQFEIVSPNGVMCHLKALETKGWITREANKSRAIQFTDSSLPQLNLPITAHVRTTGVVKNKQTTNLSLAAIAAPGNIVLHVETGAVKDMHAGDYLVLRPQDRYGMKEPVAWKHGSNLCIGEFSAVPEKTEVIGRLVSVIRPF